MFLASWSAFSASWKLNYNEIMLSSSGSKVVPSPTNPFDSFKLFCLEVLWVLLFFWIVLINFFSELYRFSVLILFFYFGLVLRGLSLLREPINKLCCTYWPPNLNWLREVLPKSVFYVWFFCWLKLYFCLMAFFFWFIIFSILSSMICFYTSCLRLGVFLSW